MATSKSPEGKVEAYLKKIVNAHDGEYRKWVSPGRKGVPDDVIICPCFEPSMQSVECKAPGKTPDPHQLREHERLEKAGGVVHVVDSEDAIDELFFLMCGNSEHN